MGKFEQSIIDEMHMHFDKLIEYPRDQWDKIRPFLSVVEVDSKHRLQAVGEKSTHHYFIGKGLVRFYYLTAEGKELNKGFYKKNHIVGSLSATILDEPCRFAIETLEPSTLVKIDLAGIRSSGIDSPAWARLHVYSCEMMLIRNERREAELLTLTSKQRFQQFVRNFPELFKRIPQYHIASYLGITAVALSKNKQQWLEEVSEDV